MKATVWVFLVATGFAFLWLVPKIKTGTWRAVTVRAAHLSLLGAGTIGASGWIGSWITSGLNIVTHAVGASSSAVVGTNAVVGIVALALCGLWIAGMLPTKWIKFDPPDWLAWAGLLLPAIAVQIPGPLGDAVHSVITGTGSLIVALASSVVGA